MGIADIQKELMELTKSVELAEYMLRQQAKKLDELEKQGEPLSDEEIIKIHLECWDEIEFARAIEERHGIK